MEIDKKYIYFNKILDINYYSVGTWQFYILPTLGFLL